MPPSMIVRSGVRRFTTPGDTLTRMTDFSQGTNEGDAASQMKYFRPRFGWRLRTSVGVLGALALVATALGGGRPTVDRMAPTLTLTATTAPPHIMLIVEENRPYNTVIGSAFAPYLNTLASTYVSATNWYAVQHTSEDDYVELISGANQGIPIGKPYASSTLVDELHAKGIPWKAYIENLPSDCFKGQTTNGLSDVFHNPFHYFTRYGTTTGKWCSSTDLSTEGVVPYPGSSALVSALDATSAPDFVDLVPNDCNEMHGDKKTGSTCATDDQRQLITAGDTWLSTNLPSILNSAWFKANGTVIVTWDESGSTDSTGCCGGVATGGHIPTIVISSLNKGRGAFTSIGDHYGTLAAIEKAYGVTLLLNSANATNGDLSGAFG
jgi:phosphatidylinositol-3-phosphatase